ncbi:hypothetical protein QOZ80_2AG0120600 [Eleusine coracana subsp. coracana]|nr:hypothetical protein QOZ80_2AG0120600 [Eleusine coracana subsp. coracana]
MGYATSTSNAAATVTFRNTKLGVHPALTVAAFSSRGPSATSPGLLKPNVMAPGLNILAAWPPQLGNSAGQRFSIISGTSMATPHVSGVAALIKSVHPDWSPAAIKSAIMTTADVVDNAGGYFLDERRERAGAYATGAGHVNPRRAADPGMVYDLGVLDYAAYICALLNDRALATIVRNTSLSCAMLPKTTEAQLNYPTITVPLSSTKSFTVNRTVTSVGPAESTYAVLVDMPDSLLTVRVSPEKLVFSKVGEKMFSVTVGSARGQDVVECSLKWVSAKHVVRSPIVAVVGLDGALTMSGNHN